MCEFKVGDKVKLTDYSWSRTINEKGELEFAGRVSRERPEPLVVESLNCSVDPKEIYFDDRPVEPNNIMLRNTETGRVVFTNTDFLRHASPIPVQLLRRSNDREDAFSYALAGLKFPVREKIEDRILRKMLEAIEEWVDEPHELEMLVEAYRKFKDTIKE